MGLMMQWTLGLALAAAPIMASAGAESAPQQPTAEMSARRAAYAAWQLSAVDALLDNGSADALYAAAMLLPRPSPYGDTEAVAEAMQEVAARRLALLDRAAEREPTAGDIAFAALRVCDAVDSCEVSEYAERLHRAVPQGGMWLLPALHKADKEGDAEQVSAILARMATAEQMDSWYGPSFQRLMRASQSITLPPLPSVILEEAKAESPSDQDISDYLASMAAVSAMISAWPRYADLDRSCRPGNDDAATRRDACRAIGMALGKGSSIIDNMIGLGLREMAAETEAQRALVKADKRQSLWIMHTRTSIEPKDRHNVLQAVAKYGSEMEASTALAAQAGLPTTPPAGWISEREQRDLLQDLERR